jgi:hypothetical protein
VEPTLMPWASWKMFEQRVGEMMGLPKGKQREGPTGKTGLDVQTRTLGVQCKYGKQVPQLLISALENAEKCCESMRDERDPVAVFGRPGWRKHQFIVALRFDDYLELRRHAGRDGVSTWDTWEGS